MHIFKTFNQKIDLLLNPQHKYFRFRRKIFNVLSILVLIFLLFFVVLIWDIPSLKSLENPQIAVSTQIYSRDGKLLGNFYDDQFRINVRYKDLPKTLINALIATEDIRFYHHQGVDTRAIGAVFLEMIEGRVRGGSTITMQLARNLFDNIGRKKSILRKMREAITAWLLERNYTKEEILMFYFNTVNLGGNIHGIQTAARTYFNKNARELLPHECALLVGMLKGPSLYHPIKKPKNALERRNVVLHQLYKYGYLTQKEYEKYKAMPLNVSTKSSFQDFIPQGTALYFRQALQQFLNEWCEKNKYNLYTDGLKIYTTLDSRLQEHAEKAIQKRMPFFQDLLNQELKTRKPWEQNEQILYAAMKRSPRYHILKNAGFNEQQIRQSFDKHVLMKIFDWKSPNYEKDTVLTPWDSLKYYAGLLHTGLITIDPSNGHILAYVGGIDFKFFPYDIITQERRQAGTIFMPFVYAAAFEKGLDPCSIELNTPISIKTPEGDLWTPKNIGGWVTEPLPLIQAFSMMYNIVVARLTQKISVDFIIDVAGKLGITSPLKAVPSLGLGTADLNLFELAAAYAPFANKGIWNQPIFVTKIEDKYGNLLADFTSNQRKAISEQSAAYTLECLRYTANNGTASEARSIYRIPTDIAGMTGRTQSHADSWFVGMTPNTVTAIWTGCIDRRVFFKSYFHGQGAFLCLPIWGEYMQNAYFDPTIHLPDRLFLKPLNYNFSLNCLKTNIQKERN